jgi:hypothetical protein
VTESVAGAKTVVNGKHLAIDQNIVRKVAEAFSTHQKKIAKITPIGIFDSNSQFKKEKNVTLKAKCIVDSL